MGLFDIPVAGVNYISQQQTNAMNRDLWREQMAYNTPAKQMQRYADAGLNPNLIYGQGNPGNADKPPSMDAPHLSAIDTAAGVFSLLQSMENLKLTRAQTANQQAAADATNTYKRGLAEQQTDLAAVKSGIGRNQWDMIAIDNAIKQFIEGARDENGRWIIDKDSNSYSVEKAASTIDLIRNKVQETIARTAGLTEDAKFKEVQSFFAILRKQLGVAPNDPVWVRFGAQMLQMLGLGRLVKTVFGISTQTINALYE